MSETTDRDKLLAEIAAGLGKLNLDGLLRLSKVIAEVSKGASGETDQERGERLGLRHRREAPFGHGPGGGFVMHGTKQGDDDHED